MMNRAMVSTFAKFDQELNLENFDDINYLIKSKEEENSVSDPRNKSDHIPNDIKKAFSLPEDMTNLEIDFLEVRKVDAQFKKRTAVWSG